MTALHPVRERVWARLYKIEAHTRQGGLCVYCKVPLPLAEATAEHRRPRALNGATTAANIDAACWSCNNAKRHRTRSQFMRAIHEPDFQRDPWPLYLACVEIRLKLRTALACRRLGRMVGI
jgi:5-methylcytosine-specific restriction endonuclease McrA